MRLDILQGLRTALETGDHSHYQGPHMEDTILEAVQLLAEAMECVDGDLTDVAAEYARVEQERQRLEDELEMAHRRNLDLMGLNTQLKTYITAAVPAPRSLEQYKAVILANAMGKTPAQWAGQIMGGELGIADKEELLKWLEDRQGNALLVEGDPCELD